MTTIPAEAREANLGDTPDVVFVCNLLILMMMDRFKDKIALVSGATSGIGLASARRIAQEGAVAVIAGHLMEHVGSTVEQLRAEGLKAEGIYYDATDIDSVRKAIEGVATAHGRIDVLVNNVGGTDMHRDGPVAELDMAYFGDAMRLNTESTLEATRTALAHMGEGAAIVNVASIGGITGDLRGTLYGLAKAAVINLTRYTATQYGHLGIRCNAVAPGLILTKAALDNLDAKVRDVFASQTPLPYFGLPEDIGATVAFLASDDARFITGQTIIADGGMLCHNPTALTIMGM